MNNKQFIKILTHEIHLKLAMMEELDDSHFIKNVCHSGMNLMKALLDQIEKDE
jgi:hypothetical protein